MNWTKTNLLTSMRENGIIKLYVMETSPCGSGKGRGNSAGLATRWSAVDAEKQIGRTVFKQQRKEGEKRLRP
jgi:hypothetical protein